MPSKITANAIAAGSAGFLRPTFSSLSKVVEKCDNKLPNCLGQEQNEIKNEVKNGSNDEATNRQNEVIVLPAVTSDSPLHSSASVTHRSKNSDVSTVRNSEDQTPMQKDAKSVLSPLSIKTKSEFDKDNETKIRDARKVCDELRLQIEDLKKQQKKFVSRLSGEFKKLDIGNGDVESTTESPNVIPQLPDCVDCKKNSAEQNNNCGEFKVELVEPEKPQLHHLNQNGGNKEDAVPSSSEESFNLHGSMTSSDLPDCVIKDEWLGSKGILRDAPPSKVIKRLVSEKERYKKKVKHLQAALHRMKKQALLPLSRTPDIAAHDIVYFNADLIGEGYLSYVYSGIVYKNQKAAIKKLIRPDMMSTSDRSYLAAEAGLLMALHHQNIVEVYGVSTAPLQPLIITELVKGRTLHERLHSSDGWPLSPAEYYSIVRDITVGMAYLHGQKPPVLHLNLRPCNILLELSGRAKVADFGFSKIRLDAGISNRTNLSYLAPELLQFPVHLTTKLDVFSFAVITWEMATMAQPYENSSASQILDLVSSGKRMNIPSELPSGFHAVISRCWDQSPMQRPSFKELIILLETMSLPQDWKEAIQKSGINRTDTNGLITPRDDASATKSIEEDIKRSTPLKLFHSEQLKESKKEKERKRLSDELALESDMMTLGYNIPGKDVYRIESSNYLRGFKRSEHIPHNHHVTSPQKHSQDVVKQRRSLASQLSPYKYPTNHGSPVIHSYSPYYTPGKTDQLKDDRSSRYKAARNLDHELLDQRYSRTPTKLNGHRARHSLSYEKHKLPQKDDSYRALRDVPSQLKSDKLSGSHTSSETENSFDSRNDEGPHPLTNRDMRYHNQNLTVETPKIVTVRSSKTAKGKSKNHEQMKSPRSPEDLRTAVSIPYLKNLRSGDESESANGTHRSHFDEILSSYVSDACHAESKNYVDSRMKGWNSSRSAFLNREPTQASSDYIKVRSIGTTVADQALNIGDRRQADSAFSETTESLMTAFYKPDETKRKELYQSGLANNYNGIISPTVSENTIDETRRVGVASVPSTSSAHVIPSRPRHSSGGPRRVRHISEGKLLDAGPHSVNGKFLRRKDSWNKLKNSYSPEPLLPHFSSMYSTPPRSTAVPLPPALNAAEVRERQSAFARLAEDQKSRKKRDTKRHSRFVREKSYHDQRPQAPFPSNGVQNERADRSSTSTMSSATQDDVGEALTETARELNGLSEIIKNAAVKRKVSTTAKKRDQKVIEI